MWEVVFPVLTSFPWYGDVDVSIITHSTFRPHNTEAYKHTHGQSLWTEGCRTLWFISALCICLPCIHCLMMSMFFPDLDVWGPRQSETQGHRETHREWDGGRRGQKNRERNREGGGGLVLCLHSLRFWTFELKRNRMNVQLRSIHSQEIRLQSTSQSKSEQYELTSN